MNPKISLVVCTRNRADQLHRTLNAIEKLVSDDPWELVIVDNGSTDNTKHVIQNFKVNSRLPIIPGFEPKPGLSRARNHAISLARGEIIAFTDDDCYPQSDYLLCIINRMSDSTLGFCGGRVLLFDPEDQPMTIQESTQEQHFSQSTNGITPGKILGANMSVRRHCLLAHRGFDEQLGAGSRFRSGEDTDLLRRLVQSGIEGMYDPDIVVFHHHGRRSEYDRIKLVKNYSWGRGASMAKQIMLSASRKPLLKQWYWHLRASPSYQVRRELASACLYLMKNYFSRSRCKSHQADSLNE